MKDVVKYDNIVGRERRRVASDPKIAAHFLDSGGLEGIRNVPADARSICLAALTVAAEGAKADIAKPVHGLGSGVFELAIAFRGDAFRVVYAVQLAEEIWVVHAFQKKSTRGVRTPQHEIDLIKDRLKRLRGMLR